MWLAIIGSVVGGYVATLLGADGISMGSIVGSTLGGIAGIVVAFKLG